MNRRGLSFVELLLTIVLLAVTIGASLKAFVSGLDFEANFPHAREQQETGMRIEDEIRSLLAGADLSDGGSVFVSPVPASTQAVQNQSSGHALAAGSDSVAFATWSLRPSPSYLEQTSGAWQDLNGRYGPQGGTTEVALSMSPVGDAGLKQGLFRRDQKPPQSDVSTGGEERLLSPEVTDIRFEFYDGSTWQTTWDSRSGDQKGKLPAAVRVTYLRRNEQTPRSILVRLLMKPGANAGGGS